MASANTQWLTQQFWQYDQFGIDEDLDGEIDIDEGFDVCAEDDLVKFDNGGVGHFDQGSQLCYPGHPQTLPFTWQFLNNETQIEYGGAVHTILELDQNQLKIYTEETDGSTTSRYILIYRH